MQRFFNQNVAFVGVYGPKSTGKSTFCDVLLKLAQIENDYVTFLLSSLPKSSTIIKRLFIFIVYLFKKPVISMYFYSIVLVLII